MRQVEAVKKAKTSGDDEATQSLQIRLNAREAEMQRMEAALLEMHLRIDEARVEKANADLEAK